MGVAGLPQKRSETSWEGRLGPGDRIGSIGGRTLSSGLEIPDFEVPLEAKS